MQGLGMPGRGFPTSGHLPQSCGPPMDGPYNSAPINLCILPYFHVKLCEIDNTYFVDCCNPRIEIPHNIAYNRIIK